MFLRIATCFCVIALLFTSPARAELFGTGSNQFTIDFVPIGNPNNAADMTGTPNPAGAVGYTYRMGTYGVSEDMINKFNSSQALQITQIPRGSAKPATGVSWNEAARFVNWLNTSTGGFAAYKFTTGGVNDNIALWTLSDALDYDPSNRFRSKRAKYVLPSTDEWYKAAYFNSTTGMYGDYATLDGLVPTAVASGTADNTAVFDQSTSAQPADITQAGGLSPYGTMGQSGNAYEWEESEFDLVNDDGSASRNFRGGAWFSSFFALKSDQRSGFNPSSESQGTIGFRVASLNSTAIPEPGSLALLSVLGACGLWGVRRRKKQLV